MRCPCGFESRREDHDRPDRQGLRRPRRHHREMAAPSRHRCRQQAGQVHGRVRRAARAAEADSSVGAGERSTASCCRVLVAGESAVKRLYPLVRELAADGIPVAVSCRVLKLSRQPYYRWLAAPVPEAEVNEAYRANALFDAHRDDPEFGYRYLADEAEIAGYPMAARTAWRLCSANSWVSVSGKGRAKNGKRPGPAVHDDLCVVTDADGRTRHEFRADGQNRLWLTDITEHRTDEGKLYMCAIKDVYSSRIVGYSIGARMKARLAVDALEMSVARRGGEVAGCVTHSDRGSQFRSKKFTRALERRGLIGSMGSVGAAGDNAAMESFFALVQKNVLDRRRWASRKQLRLAIVTWIERTYHQRRRQARLGRLTPVEYEAIIESPAVAA